MSQKKTKTTRRAFKKAVKDQIAVSTAGRSLFWLMRMPFWKRVKYAGVIIWGVRK